MVTRDHLFTRAKFMKKDSFIDIANLILGIMAIFWFGVVMIPKMEIIPTPWNF